MNTQPPNLPDVPDSDELLAAEYVLGLLDAGKRREAQARLKHDDAFAAHVGAWETHFTPWLDAIAPVEVPVALWPRIRSTLWQNDLTTRMAATAATTVPAGSLWNQLAFWRGLAGGGFAVAAISVVALVVTLNRQAQTLAPPPPAPDVVTIVDPPRPAAVPVSMVVSMRHDDGSTAYTASIDPTTGIITLIPASMPDDTRVPELWLIPADGKPRSLGVVARDHAQRVIIPQQLRADTKANVTFAVSLEPTGGSPTGQPTGPVVAKGSVIQL